MNVTNHYLSLDIHTIYTDGRIRNSKLFSLEEFFSEIFPQPAALFFELPVVLRHLVFLFAEVAASDEAGKGPVIDVDFEPNYFSVLPPNG